MRIMGLDYGTKTVGVAISDALGLLRRDRDIQRKEETKCAVHSTRIEDW